MNQVRAGISYALTEALDDGSLQLAQGLQIEELAQLAVAQLAVPMDLELAERTVIGHGWRRVACVSSGLYRAEQGIAEQLQRLIERHAAMALHRSGTRCRG
jgi:hypothetical protein